MVAKSFVILVLSNLEDIARIKPKTKSPVRTLVLYPYLIWNGSFCLLIVSLSIMSSWIIDSICKNSTAQDAENVFSSILPTHSAAKVKIIGLIRFPPSSEYFSGSMNSDSE